MITKEEYKEPEKEYKIPTVTPNEAFDSDEEFFNSFDY